MQKKAAFRGSAAWWATALIAIVLACLGYVAWPYFSAYYDNLELRQIVKARSQSCFDPEVGRHGCVQDMIDEAARVTRIAVVHDNFSFAEFETGTQKIAIEVDYKVKLHFPFTGRFVGSERERFVAYRFKVATEKTYSW